MSQPLSGASSTGATDILDVLVIGGGQAGLAMGYTLSQRGYRFLIVEAGEALGDAWRARWDSLRLFTPAQYDGLPGMPFPAPADTYPGKDDVADYLRAYAAAFDLPVRLRTPITGLTQEDGVFVAISPEATFHAHQVVLATGPFHVPFVPTLAGQLDAGVMQLHSSAYRSPDMLPEGNILVVGGANTGTQIAAEIAATRTIDLAVGRRLPTLPQRLLGRDLWWWLTRLGLPRISTDSRLGRRMSQRDVLIGTSPRAIARRHGVTLRPRVTAAAGRTLTFADASEGAYDAVIWATGFTVDDAWVDIPEAKDATGQISHQRGVSSLPGLYVLGRSWQHTRTSALLGWVGEDATYLRQRIDATRQTSASVPARSTAHPADAA